MERRARQKLDREHRLERARLGRLQSSSTIVAEGELPPDAAYEAGQREAYRRWLWATVVPVGRLVAEELSAKLDAPISFAWDRLGAGDLQGRTRSLKQMVEAGLPLPEARWLAGLE